MTSNYLIYVTISTNISSNSKTVSDECTLVENSRTILLVIYRVSSLILFVQLTYHIYIYTYYILYIYSIVYYIYIYTICILYICVYILYIYNNNWTFIYSLGAPDGFTQPIFTKGLTDSVCKSDKMH